MDRISVLIVGFFCLLKLAMHLIADGNSGFQGDELLHIQTGNNLALGYNEFPPLIGILAFIQNLFGSSSVYIHHLFAHLATILIVIYISKITLEVGGKYKALFIVLICVVIAPGFGRSQQLFQPVVFSQLFWVMSSFYLIKYIKHFERSSLWYLTISITLGFLTKYDAAFLLISLPLLFFSGKIRRNLVKHRFWQPLLLFICLILPNLWWQYDKGFRVLQMMQRLKETQLDQLNGLDNLISLVLSINPVAVIVYIPIFLSIFHKRFRKYLPFLLITLFSTSLLMLNDAKAYYYFPILLSLLPFGAVYWEKVILNNRSKLIYPLMLILCSGSLLISFGLALSSLKSYLEVEYKYEGRLEEGRYSIKFEERYSNLHWDEVLRELSAAHKSYISEDVKDGLVWAKHYKQAGAALLFKEQYGLPTAFSLHGSFYNWLPAGNMPDVILAFRYSGADGGDFFQPYFETVEAVKSIYNPYARDEEDVWTTIFLCKGPKQDFNALRRMFSKRIFE